MCGFCNYESSKKLLYCNRGFDRNDLPELTTINPLQCVREWPINIFFSLCSFERNWYVCHRLRLQRVVWNWCMSVLTSYNRQKLNSDFNILLKLIIFCCTCQTRIWTRRLTNSILQNHINKATTIIPSASIRVPYLRESYSLSHTTTSKISDQAREKLRHKLLKLCMNMQIMVDSCSACRYSLRHEQTTTLLNCHHQRNNHVSSKKKVTIMSSMSTSLAFLMIRLNREKGVL